MTTTHHPWEEETRKHLADLQTELHNAKKQFDHYKARIDSLTVEVQAYDTVLRSHLTRTGKMGSLQEDMRAVLAQQKNHIERLKRIGEQNGGLIRVGPAADILYSLHLMKSRSRMNAYRIVYGLCTRMVGDKVLEKVGEAEFRLIGAQGKLSVS